jgi:glutamine---fructose-6-phosphate transaminase (isomerizing)
MSLLLACNRRGATVQRLARLTGAPKCSKTFRHLTKYTSHTQIQSASQSVHTTKATASLHTSLTHVRPCTTRVVTRHAPVMDMVSSVARLHSQTEPAGTRHHQQAGSSSSSSWNWRSILGLAAGSIAATAMSMYATSDEADACGIIAYVGSEPAVQYLVEGLTILQSRGYDSAGVCTFSSSSQELVTTKYASRGTTSDSIETLAKHAPGRHGTDSIGIGHTRWATHGGKTDHNAHPHSDQKGRIALVHNGTIENSDTLRNDLIAQGVVFKSETDTEVIAQLIGVHLDKGEHLEQAIKSALTQLQGTWGLVVMHRDMPDRLIACRNGSPLVVGVGQGRMFVASEVSAFSRHCAEFVSLQDGEVATISTNGDISLDLSRVETAPSEEILLSPEPFPHWTIKEIMEQPEAIARTLGHGSRLAFDGGVRLGGLERNRDQLLAIQNLIIAACGTSLYAGMYGAHLMRELDTFTTVQPMDASEIDSHVLVRDGTGGVLAITQSGETKDVHRTIELSGELNLPRFSIVNAVGSLIARTTKCGVYLYAGRENAVASTKAFTSQVVALSLVSAWFAQNRRSVTGSVMRNSQNLEDLMDSLHRLPTYVGMTLRNRPACAQLANEIKDADHMFVLGKGYGYPVAMEGALKVKEITYVHAEGYAGGALKHGPFALIDDGTPIVLLILDDEHAELMRIAAAQVKARGAKTIIITDKPSLAVGLADTVLPIPSNGPLTALLATIPLQLLAYEMSIARGVDPDKPRHLAKAVTVD